MMDVVAKSRGRVRDSDDREVPSLISVVRLERVSLMPCTTIAQPLVHPYTISTTKHPYSNPPPRVSSIEGGRL